MPKANDQEDVNLALVRRMWDAFNDEGIVGILAFASPDAHWRPYTAGGRVFETTAEYRSYIESMVGREELIEATLSEVKARGDHVLVNGRMRVRDSTGLHDTNLYWVHRIRDEKIVYTASFLTVEEALAAAESAP